MKKHRKRNLTVMLVAIAVVLAVMVAWPPIGYGIARWRCGGYPVIVSGGYINVPSEVNNDLISQYDTDNLNIWRYSWPIFFCSENEAISAGYSLHPCCGLGPYDNFHQKR